MKGAYIRQQRKRRGLSQSALGALIGTDGTSVSRWERGTVEPGPEAEERLRTVFAGRDSAPDGSSQLDRIEAKLDALLAMASVAEP